VNENHAENFLTKVAKLRKRVAVANHKIRFWKKRLEYAVIICIAASSIIFYLGIKHYLPNYLVFILFLIILILGGAYRRYAQNQEFKFKEERIVWKTFLEELLKTIK